MSEFKLISPLLENFDMGDPISEHDGVRCCPAMEKDSDSRYIVKIISVPASQTQLDALLLTGAYPDESAALSYFEELSNSVVDEFHVLRRLASLEGFLPIEGYQVVPMERGTGYLIYLLSSYKRTLERHFSREPMTHLAAINLGLDLCAALTVCRRAGYLYVDLKPSNIFVTENKGFRIGDLGFIRLDSLKYTSLPDKYRSAYTAPEICDAFASLNKTIDIYAVGLILYQTYNNGVLPVRAEDESLVAPEYADYEMAEIILKACASDPADRWQDPVEMGQALVSYMQRNGANDIPIIPAAIEHIDEQPTILLAGKSFDSCEAEQIADDENTVEVLEDAMTAVEHENEHPFDTILNESIDHSAELIVFADEEDSFENLSFLLENNDETDPGNLLTDVDDVAITEEVSDILSQADALAELQVPNPVIAPDPIEIPIPEPIPMTPTDAVLEEAPSDDVPAEDIADGAVPDEESKEEPQQTPEPKISDDAVAVSSTAAEPTVRKKTSGRWLLITLCALVIVALTAAGFLYYRYFYLLPISISLDGTENTLVVQVNTDVDDSLLKVVCSNSHGNQITASVINGKATFENLAPNTAYNIKVIVDGFHKLTGNVATSYSTPAQTNIVQFSAVTGAEDGSVILSFTVDRPDAGQWSVTYWTDGEASKTVTFPSHMVTLTGLTVGKEYTFKLLPDTDSYVTGTSEITFTASKLVYAQDLIITSLIDGKLTASWAVPADTAVSSWTVRCYNDTGYNETIITSDTTAVFEGLQETENYTVEVTAAGMSVSQRTYVSANAFTITNFHADVSNPAGMVLTWDTLRQAPEGGWLLTYSIDGAEMQSSVSCTGNRAEISPFIPGATYIFTLQESNGTAVLAEPFTFKVPEAQAFNSYGITPENMKIALYKAPNITYTNQFSNQDKIYMLITLLKRTEKSTDNTTVLFAVRDEAGLVVSHESTALVWDKMWTGGDCILAIPDTPTTPGSYTICIYFNGQFVTEQNITVSAAD